MTRDTDESEEMTFRLSKVVGSTRKKATAHTVERDGDSDRRGTFFPFELGDECWAENRAKPEK